MEQELIDEYNRGLSDGVRMNLTGETAYLQARIRGLEEKLKEAMHWLPMTEDAVFEDGGKYLVAYHSQGKPFEYHDAYYDVASNVFYGDVRKHYPESITHYARITEPK